MVGVGPVCVVVFAVVVWDVSIAVVVAAVLVAIAAQRNKGTSVPEI